jgi:predicted  nucleic acid-binding Zn-ribbon protein
MKPCEKCGESFDDGGNEWKTVCKKCYALSKGAKPFTKQKEVSSFKSADKVSPNDDSNRWMNPIYAECFAFVLDLINGQHEDNAKAFSTDSLASMVNTLFTRRVER